MKEQVALPVRAAACFAAFCLKFIRVLMLGDEGATFVAATDERQVGIVFRTAARMVELHPELERRVQPYKSELKVPSGARHSFNPEISRCSGTTRWQGFIDARNRLRSVPTFCPQFAHIYP